MAWRRRNGSDPWARATLALALEPRIMFDAAGVATYVDAHDTTSSSDDLDEMISPPGPEPRREVVVIDTGIHGWADLRDAVPDGYDVILIDPGTDGVIALADALASTSGVHALHIVSHGSVGTIFLGTATLSEETLTNYADHLAVIGRSLAPEGDILLYGCNVGQDGGGTSFLSSLASLTGADIAASDDLTGASSLGANWELEISIGSIDDSHLPELFASAEFFGVLTPASLIFDDVPTQNVFDDQLVIGNWRIEWIENGAVRAPGSGEFGTFQVGTTGFTDLGSGGAGDKFLTASGFFNEVNGVLFTSLTVNFTLNSFQIAHGPFDSETTLRVEGLSGSTVQATFDFTVVDAAPADNPSQQVTLTGPQWQNLSAFRIVTQSGAKDIAFYLDDVIVTVPPPNTPPELTGTPTNPTINDTATATPFSGLGFDDTDGDGGTVTITYTAANGTLSLPGPDSAALDGMPGNYTLSGANPAELSTRLQALVFTPTQNQVAPGSTVATTFTLTPNDGAVNGTAITADVTATSVNDAPVLGGLPVAAVAVNDNATVQPFTGATIADPDPGQTITVTVTLDDNAKGAFTPASLTASGFAFAGGLYTFSGASAAAAETALRALVFAPTANRVAPGATETTTFTVTVSDGTAQASGNAQAVSTGVNDAPTLTNGASVAMIGTNENETAPDGTLVSALLAGAGYADPDPGALSGIAVTGATVVGGGIWFYSLDGASWTNFGTPSNTSALLLTSTSQLRFVPDGIVGGTVTLTFRAWDQTSGMASTAGTPHFADTSVTGGTTAFSAEQATATKAITDINDPPTLAATPTSPTFTEGGTPAALFSGVTISTVEPGQTIVGLTLTVSNLADGAAERLLIGGAALALTNGNSIAIPGGGTASVLVTGATATVTLTGLAAPPAQAQTLVQGLAYENTSDNPTVAGARTVTLTAITDSGGTANGGQDTTALSIASAVTLVAVNDSPSLGATTFALAGTQEGVTSSATAVSTITTALTFADPDGPGRGLAVIGSTGTGTWEFSLDGGTNWTAFGTVGVAQALLLPDAAQIRYVPTGTVGEVASLTVRGWDTSSGTPGTEADATTFGTSTAFSSQSATLSLTVADVNDPPVLTGTVGGTFTETVTNAGAGASGSPVLLVSSTASVTDPDQPANFVGATLAVSFAGYQPGDRIGFSASFGAYTYDGGTGQIQSGGIPVATVAGGVGGPLVVTFTAAATNAIVNDVLRNVLYVHVGDNPTAFGTQTTRAVSVVFNDGGNTGSGGALGSNTLTGTLTLVALNDPPTVTTSGGSAGFTEKAPAVAIDPDLVVTDPDSLTLATATIAITANFQAGADVLAFANDGTTMGNITGTYDAATGVLTLVSTGATATLAQWQAALRTVTFENTSLDPTAATRTIAFTAGDGEATSPVATRQVTVTPVNDAPTDDPAFGWVNTGASTETSGLVTITNAMLNEGDPDDSGAGVTFTITTATTQGTLFRDANANGLVDGGEALGLGATFTQADIDAGRIKYLHGGGAGTSDSFGFSVSDSGADGALPLTGQTFTITIADRPVVAIGGGSPAHVEDAGPTIIAPNLTISDADSPNMAGASIRITDPLVGDLLLFTDQNGITGSFNAGTFTLTLTGTATIAHYQAALRSITYSTTNDNPATGPGNNDRVIEFRVSDGGLQSVAVTQTVTVENANDAPVLDPAQSPVFVGILEDLGPPTNGSIANSTLVSAFTIGVTDPDIGAAAGIAVIGTSAQGTLWYTTNGGATWIQAPAVAPGAALLLADDGQTRVYFQPAPNVFGTIADAITFRAWDQTAGTIGGSADTTTNGGGTAFSIATDTAAITITGVNDAPTLAGSAFTLPPTDEKTTSAAVSVASILAGLGYNDVDFADAAAARADGGIAITATTGSGTWQYSTNGTDWFGVGFASPSVALLLDASAQIRYVPDNANGETVSIGLRGWDRTSGTATVGAARGIGDTTTNGGMSAFSETIAAASLVVADVNDPPTIAGVTALTAIDDTPGSTATPFTGVTITDIDNGAVLTVTVTLDDAGRGGFTSASLIASGFQAVSGTPGAFRLVGASPADATIAIRQLVFVPTENRVAPGSTETTTLTVTVSDGIASANAAAAVVTTSVNDAPVLGGLVLGQTATDKDAVSPFAATIIVDPDVGQPITVSVTIGQPGQGGFTAGSLAATGFAATGAPGVFSLTASSAAEAQAALRTLVFQPVENRLAPGGVETTTFSVSVSDGVAPPVGGTASVVVTSVNDAPAITGIGALQTVAHDGTLPLFSAVSVADPDPGQTFGITVQILAPAAGSLTAASLAAAGFVDIGAGQYQRNGLADPAAVQEALRALVFRPTPDSVPPGALALAAVQVTVTDGAASTSAIASLRIVGPASDAPAPIPAPPPPPIAPPPPAPVAPPPPVVFNPAPPMPVPPLAAPPLPAFGPAPIVATPEIAAPAVAPSLEPITVRSGFFVAPQDGVPTGVPIRAATPIGDFVLRSGSGPSSFSLPPSTFVLEAAGAQVLVGALLADGSPMPAWVEFDPATGTFRIDVPAGFSGTLDIVVTATLGSGESASAAFRIEVDAQSEPAAPEEPAPRRQGTAPASEPVQLHAQAGKPAFSDAVKAASRGAWATQAQSLLDDLIAALPGERPSGEIEADSRNGRDAA